MRISDTALVQVRDYVKKEWGEGYLPEKPRYYKSKKGAQGAHEAIRPTSVNRTPDSIRDSLTRTSTRYTALSGNVLLRPRWWMRCTIR